MSASDSPIMTLRDGNLMPQLGLGVYKASPEETLEMVSTALAEGYRLIDTASMYLNEEAVGQAIRRSGVGRDDVFVTTKLYLEDLGYENTLRACERSLDLLGTDYIDLYMIHWPAPARNLYPESWRAMHQLKDSGLVRSIGVSNFHPEHLDRLRELGFETPVVNQIEIHPWLTQDAVLEYHRRYDIVSQAWSPLARGQILEEPALLELASNYKKTVAQIVIRWHLQRGYSVIPKSTRRERIIDNANVFDFILSDHDMSTISSLNKNYRTGVDPNDRN